MSQLARASHSCLASHPIKKYQEAIMIAKDTTMIGKTAIMADKDVILADEEAITKG